MSEDAVPHPVLSAERFVIVQYVWVAPMALWLFEYFTQLDEEVLYVWEAKFSAITLLFSLCRFCPALLVPFAWATRFASQDISAESCRALTWMRLILSGVSVYSTQAILTLRTYSLYAPNKTMKKALCALYASCLIVSMAVISFYISTIEFSPQPLPTLKGCYVRSTGSVWIYSSYLGVMIVLELLLVSLNLYAWFKRYRATNHPLPRILQQGGALHLLSIFSLSITEAIVMSLSPEEFSDVFETLQIVMISVIAARIHFQLRSQLLASSRNRRSRRFECAEDGGRCCVTASTTQATYMSTHSSDPQFSTCVDSEAGYDYYAFGLNEFQDTSADVAESPSRTTRR